MGAIRILNYRFHLIVCGASVYPWLTRIISALWIRLPSKTVWSVPTEAKAALRYHNDIIRAIKKGDASLAGALMEKHLHRSKSFLFG